MMKADVDGLEEDVAGLKADIAEFKAWFARQMLIFLCIVILIATIAVAASKAIP